MKLRSIKHHHIAASMSMDTVVIRLDAQTVAKISGLRAIGRIRDIHAWAQAALAYHAKTLKTS